MSVTRQVRITKSLVDRMAKGEILRDTELKGFGVRRQLDTPSYFLQKRINGRLRWLSIGPHGSPWTADTARKKALSLLASIADGADPATLKRDRLENPTLSEAGQQFLEEYVPKLKPTTRKQYDHFFNRHIKAGLGTHRLMDIKRADVERFHVKLAGKKRTANYCISILSKLMNWAEVEGYRPQNTNPCYRANRFATVHRHRYLTVAELEALGAVLEQREQESEEDLFIVAAIRLLLFTGARLNEILTLQWPFVDFQNGYLTLPDSKTGQKQIRMNTETVSVLEGLPRIRSNPYVIVGRYNHSHLVNLQKPWRRIRELAGINDVRLHDLRHSFASVAADKKGSLLMIGKLLGHKSTRTTARYAHLTELPAQELNEEVGAAIAEALSRSKQSEASRLARDPQRRERLRSLLNTADKIAEEEEL